MRLGELRVQRFRIFREQHPERVRHCARFRFERRKLRARGRELGTLLIYFEVGDEAGTALGFEQTQGVLLTLDRIAGDLQPRACGTERKVVDGDLRG